MESIQRMWCRLQIYALHTGSSEVVTEDYKRQGTESCTRGPLVHTAAKCFPGGKELTDPNTSQYYTAIMASY